VAHRGEAEQKASGVTETIAFGRQRGGGIRRDWRAWRRSAGAGAAAQPWALAAPVNEIMA